MVGPLFRPGAVAQEPGRILQLVLIGIVPWRAIQGTLEKYLEEGADTPVPVLVMIHPNVP